jgi:hypothetical protein
MRDNRVARGLQNSKAKDSLVELQGLIAGLPGVSGPLKSALVVGTFIAFIDVLKRKEITVN